MTRNSPKAGATRSHSQGNRRESAAARYSSAWRKTTSAASADRRRRLARQGFDGGEVFETRADARRARSETGHFVLRCTFLKPAFTTKCAINACEPGFARV